MNNLLNSERMMAGWMLIFGSITTIICILLEVHAGWASLTEELNRTDWEAGIFLSENWSEMSMIWFWALIGNVFLAIGALLLLSSHQKIGWFPSNFFWSIYFLASLLQIISFSISLGSYEAAFKLLEKQEEIFEAFRGTPIFLFQLGAFMGSSIFIPFFFHGFKKNGLIPQWAAILTLFLILSSLGLVILGWVSFAIFAIACYVAPLFTGIYFSKTHGILKES